MKRWRKEASLVLGLVFLIQGIAAFAGPATQAQPEHAPISAEMPCHGKPAPADQDHGSCCGPDCPNMVGCLLVHIAMAADAAFVTPHSPAEVPLLVTPRATSLDPPLLLRPPITLHG